MQKCNLRMNSWYLWRLTWKVSLHLPLTDLFVPWLLSYAPIHFLLLSAFPTILLTTKYCGGGLEFPWHRFSLNPLWLPRATCPQESDYFPKREWIWLVYHSFQIGSYCVRGPVLTAQLWLEEARSCGWKQILWVAPSAGAGRALQFPKREYGQEINYTLDTNSEKNGLNSIKQRGASMYNVCLCFTS